ncbi:hypothetical protein BH10PSE19_BH10PSE19_06690 [soil metagenome]
MGRILINNVPTWALFLSMVFLIVAFAVTVRFITSRYFPHLRLNKNDYITTYIDILRSGETIFIAFTVIVLWQTYTTTKLFVSQEANELAKVIIDSQVFSAKEKLVLERGVKNYIQILRQEEWPLMREGKKSANAEKAFANLFYLLAQNASPSDEKERVYYREIISSLNKAAEARRFRLEKVNSNVPTIIVVVIVISSLSLIALLAMLEEDRFVMRSLVYLVSIVIALYLSLILLLDYPFSGEISVSNQPFTEGILENLGG